MSRRAPARITRDTLIVLVNGPMDGHWWTEKDWLGAVRAAERMAEYEDGESVFLGYRKTQGRRDNPRYEGESGVVWKWHIDPPPRKPMTRTTRTGRSYRR